MRAGYQCRLAGSHCGSGTPRLQPGVAVRLAGTHVRRMGGARVGRGAYVNHRSRSWRTGTEPSPPDDQRCGHRHPRCHGTGPGGHRRRLGIHRSIHPWATAAALGNRRGVRRRPAGAAARRDCPVGGRVDPHAADRRVRGRPARRCRSADRSGRAQRNSRRRTRRRRGVRGRSSQRGRGWPTARPPAVRDRPRRRRRCAQPARAGGRGARTGSGVPRPLRAARA